MTSYPIRETPPSLILQKQVELRSDEFETSHSVRNGITSIVRTKTPAKAPASSRWNSPTSPSSCGNGRSGMPPMTTTVTLQNMKSGHS